MPEPQRAALRAEWSMAELDHQAMDRLRNQAHDLMIALELDWRQTYSMLAALREFYRIMRPLQNEKVQKDFDKKFTDLEVYVLPIMAAIEKKVMTLNARGQSAVIRLPESVYKRFDVLFNELYDLRQRSNLGIPARKHVTDEVKKNDAFGL